MKMNNPAQMKALVKNKARSLDVPANVALHMYVMERFIDRLSRSEYRDRFVLKGGFLIYSMEGLNRRTTEDIDLTSKTESVSETEILDIMNSICGTDAGDDFEMTVVRTRPIAEILEHPGIRVFVDAEYGVVERFYVDIVPSPRIVPEAVEHRIVPFFDQEPIVVMAYRIETVIAEKIHAALTRGLDNTRMRDYYDFFVMAHQHQWDASLLREAVEYIFTDRRTTDSLENWKAIVDAIEADKDMEVLWKAYRRDHEYADGIEFSDACVSLRSLILNARPESSEEQ